MNTLYNSRTGKNYGTPGCNMSSIEASDDTIQECQYIIHGESLEKQEETDAQHQQ